MTTKRDPIFCDPTCWGSYIEEKQEWLFHNTIPAGHVSMLSGQGGIGKSTLSRILALSAMTYRTLLPAFPISSYAGYSSGHDRRRRVIMLSGEDDDGAIFRSMIAIADMYKITEDELSDAIGDRLFLRAGCSDHFLERDEWGDWCNTDVLNKISETAEDGDALIIVDPLRRFYGGPENDNQHAGRFMEACVALVRDTGNTVLLVHHSDKKTGQPRGASAFRDESRAGFILESKKPGEVTLTHDKHNLGPKHDPVELVFDGACLRERGFDGGASTSSAVLWFSEHPGVTMTLGGLEQGKGAAAQELLAYMAKCHPDTAKKDVCLSVKAALSSGLLVEAPIKGRNGKISKTLRVKEMLT